MVLGKFFNSLWHNLYAFGQIFIAEKWPNIESTIWSHGVCVIDGIISFVTGYNYWSIPTPEADSTSKFSTQIYAMFNLKQSDWLL